MAKVSFLLDEHLPHALARELRRHGFDALSAIEAGLRSAPDAVYITLALETGRVVVTFDHDFLEWHYTGRPHGGIVFFRTKRYTLGEMIECLMLVDEIYDTGQMGNRLERF